MQHELSGVEQMEPQQLPHFILDAFRRIVVHYGQWLAQAEHQFGMEKAMEIEAEVWEASFGNQITRLGKTLGFEVAAGRPAFLESLDRDTASVSSKAWPSTGSPMMVSGSRRSKKDAA